MADSKKKNHIEKPFYPGGKKALALFIKENLTYPESALEARIEGSVYCRYGIDYKGKVKDVKVLQSLGYGCDEEAIKLIKSLQFSMPRIPRKMKALFHKTLRIHFVLPKKQSVVYTEFKYSIIQKKSKRAHQQIAKSVKKFSYTIDV